MSFLAARGCQSCLASCGRAGGQVSCLFHCWRVGIGKAGGIRMGLGVIVMTLGVLAAWDTAGEGEGVRPAWQAAAGRGCRYAGCFAFAGRESGSRTRSGPMGGIRGS